MSENESGNRKGVETKSDAESELKLNTNSGSETSKNETTLIAVEGPEKLVDKVCALNPNLVPARSFGGWTELILIVREAPERKPDEAASRRFLTLKSRYERSVRSLPSARGPARSDPAAERLRRKRLDLRQAFVNDWAQLMVDCPELSKSDYWRLDGRPKRKQWVDYNEARKLCGIMSEARKRPRNPEIARVPTPEDRDVELANGYLQCWRGADAAGVERPWVVDPATNEVIQSGTGEPDPGWTI